MESHRPDTRSRADSQWGGAEPGEHQPYLQDTWTNDILIGYHTSRTTKSSNFKHPYSIVQKVTTGPCGASVVISCSGADHKGVFKNIIKITGRSSLPQQPSNCDVLLKVLAWTHCSESGQVCWWWLQCWLVEPGFSWSWEEQRHNHLCQTLEARHRFLSHQSSGDQEHTWWGSTCHWDMSSKCHIPLA